jgi:hypothetical protein
MKRQMAATVKDVPPVNKALKVTSAAKSPQWRDELHM